MINLYCLLKIIWQLGFIQFNSYSEEKRKENYMKTGKGLESLYRNINSDMKRECILKHDYSEIKIEKVGDNIEWQLRHKCENHTTGKTYAGKTLPSFINKLEELYKDSVCRTVPEVCALLDITDGVATYVVASTEVNSKGDFEFRKIKREVTEYEKGICLETRLALWDETYFYPFTSVSVQGAGNLLDAHASFKTIAEVPLGAALLLSEKIESRRNLDIIYEDNKTNVRPLIALCTSKFGGYSPTDFLKNMIERVGDKKFIYDDKNVEWEMKDKVITLDIPMDGLGMYRKNYDLLSYVPIIRLSTSYIPGSANRVELLAKVGDGYVLLKQHKKNHNDMDLSEFLDEFEEEIDKFNLVVKNDIFVDKDELSNLRKIVGDKRFNTYTKVNKTCSVKAFISDTWRELPPKQYYLLMEFYRDYIYKKSK